MKLSKKIVSSSILSLGLTMGALVPATHAFDLASVDLTKQVSNTLTASFNISEPTNKVLLSWNDGSNGQFTAEAGQTIETSVKVAPLTDRAEVTVLLKVPAGIYMNDVLVKVKQEEVPDTSVYATYESDENFDYVVLGEELYVYVDGGPQPEIINFDITFGVAGEYTFDIIAVDDPSDYESDVNGPSVTNLGIAPTNFETQSEISIEFSERITYLSKALVQQEIINRYDGATDEDFYFEWFYDKENGTETFYAINKSDSSFSYSESTSSVNITDLNTNSSTVQILE